MICEPNNPCDSDTLVQLMAHRYGIDISSYSPTFLMRSLERRTQATGCTSTAIYLLLLEQNQIEAKTFHQSLRVGYSTFFRDAISFALLEQRILPELIDKKGKNPPNELRIWSAGCSAGQEAWSIAILLDELLVAHPQLTWRIFATDTDEHDLETARTGIYSDAEIGNIRLHHVKHAFSRRDNQYTVETRLRTRMDFSLYDLLDPITACPPASIFGDFDLILCCNVLLYYRPEQQRKIVEKLVNDLAPGAYLITSEPEKQCIARAAGICEALPFAPVFQRRER